MTFRSRFSAFALARNALTGHRNWQAQWRSPEPKAAYDAIVIGGGGHGLATAYYLAKNHGLSNVAVLEKGWLGGGNTGRNTTIIRSNYFFPESTRFYDLALRLYENLAHELNYNIMFSPRGVLTLAFTRHDIEFQRRWVNAIQMTGVDSEWLTPAQIGRCVPAMAIEGGRFPVRGGFLQKRGGIARHDAVAWAYARAADALGVDIIQNCEVTGIASKSGRVTGVETSRGAIRAKKVAIAVAGHSSRLAELAGFRLPLESVTLQAFVSEPIKPVLDLVIMAGHVHVYLSQSDKGELVIGGGTDAYPSFTQRGSYPSVEQTVAAMLTLFPSFSALKMMRQWGGIVDISPDRSAIIDRTPIDNLYINCGWGTGGFKAIPAGGWATAHLMATGEHHALSAPFGLGRFARGILIDEGAAAGVAH
ncbi:sarcosine oxidase subunit beta family protein [Parasphingopyxis sp.]|uniref:sarcosine oxidase subunit beta family protein n=1 Tax=Parasphingopyxis sp. TaxID=1920299 RepID=UPI00260FC420|nr:sarcosine oxidase subunit beta family protein [Parasphingopyxis sp.]